MSDDLLPLGRDLFSREILFTLLPSWDEWPRRLELPSEHFCLLIIGDARGVSDDTLDTLANAALDGGSVYVCVWGPDCGRVETRFDFRCAEKEEAHQAPVVLTVSHQGETLDEALEYLTETAFPHAAFADTCQTCLVAVVANAEWAGRVLRHAFRPHNTPPDGPQFHS